MNILHVITHGGWAGSESIAASIANEQAARGDNVTVILRRHNAFKDKDIRNNFLPAVNIFWVEQNETHPDNQMKNLMKNELFINKITYIDILHAHLPYGCLLGKLIKEKLGLKFNICVTMHVRFHPLYYFADKLFTVAKWQKQEIPDDYSGEVFTVENFICNTTHSYIKKLFLLKRKFYIKNNYKYIIYIGRLDLVKGADILIRAFNKANPEGYKLIIVGDGAESSYLKTIASKNVIFTGKIFNAAYMLDIADICVIPSRFESFGLVLLEAINSGCRIIATNIPSFKEILESDNYLFDNESVNSLSNKIKEYTNNPSLGFVDKKKIEQYSLSNAISKLDLAYFSNNIKCDMIKNSAIEDNYDV
ncbi:glycosyltransferase family 4 protein [Gilliamella sp. GillExp13]|uniref:glycosyltransferase family 4 protein n=2 Tax=unclassified Gilliamella TaxID=2685620 RepID=UPI0004610730|nr:glycosyltransferase family 4 protein [Gilliamella apicola]KDN09849.1 Glycosyltransferase [Gilliamella apicola]OCG58312.1 glycosyl transferase family 1 [Gilliamella apicola]